MTIKESKQRLVVVLEKTVLEKIKKSAQEQKRSMSNMAAIILAAYYEKNK